uniref:uncharacterized protein LOC120329805 n=1 Tax=Styela clava TaxID=7725 RepID=UPI00193970E5|nr:uncharacterized protein LOC120329805 [Styela clava]
MVIAVADVFRRKTKILELRPKLLELSGMMWIIAAQREHFAEEINALKSDKLLSCRSPLLSLTPFFDGVFLRANGRLQESPEPLETRHPIILPYSSTKCKDSCSCRVSWLLMCAAHCRLAHSGPDAMLASIRQIILAIEGSQTCQSRNKELLAVSERSARPQPPLMANLPEVRLTEARPFLNKSLQQSEAPKGIWSDNGSNFVGASRELRQLISDLDQTRITNECLKKGIDWNFSPPYAPHFGGIWERLVKSAKRTLKAVLGNLCVTDEVLTTAFAEISDIMNSRPLTHIGDNVRDPAPLTPNCLIRGHTDANTPLDTDCTSTAHRRRWRQTEAISNQFWKRWRREYLPMLMTRTKWLKDHRNLSIDDIVIVVDDGAPRGSWLLGRVIKVFPGKDNRVRVATVKTTNGEITRPVTKLCLLENE